jgi:hypothetical protein
MNVTTPQDEVRRMRNLLEEERRNWRAKSRSFTIALILLLCIIVGLIVAVVYGLKLRTDNRDIRKHDEQQTMLLEEQRSQTETREYQLSEMRHDQDSLLAQLSRMRTERDSLQYQLLRHAKPDEYSVFNEEEGGAYAYYRRGGRFVPTDSWYDNGFELFVYLHVGEYALTDYGFFRFTDLQGTIE